MSRNPDEFDDVLDLNESDKSCISNEAIAKMRGKYTPSMMVSVLNAMFPSTEVMPCVFQTKYAIIFPPVTDNVSIQLPCIDKVISIALSSHQITVEDLKQKALIFPVAQEQCIINLPLLQGLSHVLPKRNHWVCLHYNPITKVATTLDSRPAIHSFLYFTHQLHESLRSALQAFDLAPNGMIDIKQNVQHDDIHCGAWTAFNIETLANAYSIEQLMRLIVRVKKPDLIQHFIDRVYDKKNSTLIKPIERMDEDEYEMCNEFNVTKPEIHGLLEKSMTRPQITHAINERESLRYNGRKLCFSNPIQANDLSEIFSDLEERYAGVLNSDIDETKRNNYGYSFNDCRRLINNLIMLSFSIEEINALSLTDILVYDAFIFNVLTSVECQMASESAQKLDSYQDQDEEFIEKARQNFHTERQHYRKSLLPILKDYIQKQIEAKKTSTFVEKQESLDMLIPRPVKEKSLTFANLGVCLPWLTQNCQNTNLLFINYRNGLPQVIQIETRFLIESPQKMIHQLLLTMQAHGWNIYSTQIFLRPLHPQPKLIEDAPPPPREEHSYWQGFVAMMWALLQMIQDLAVYIAQQTTCFFRANC